MPKSEPHVKPYFDWLLEDVVGIDNDIDEVRSGLVLIVVDHIYGSVRIDGVLESMLLHFGEQPENKIFVPIAGII